MRQLDKVTDAKHIAAAVAAFKRAGRRVDLAESALYIVVKGFCQYGVGTEHHMQSRCAELKDTSQLPYERILIPVTWLHVVETSLPAC